ncbi:MAG: long-chain fatty acid--CoA ligase [Nitrososphaerota archaeon]|jgi:long-chain acyl-CoA synthetase|nr:long-chain fatty acid--CoA ligase [Nitrososphaerota archaeon]MDG6942054.1 long-chain fatty acid--CoA ligase [Nitrososphaerota archaeon]MDG6942519.1 long-chain fatty acid--CoA ligase [Nitrososphaerota archaeon]MDG6948306.1 long-chain fatty acid--CoA ligase [Nitrososphaerota archaeon]MDG6950232.1 long-chain fatty acid--CoA ligase [Nitrososphaerota archaeon]
MQELLERPWLKAQVGERYSVPRPKVRPLYALLSDSAALHPGNRCLHYQGRDFTYAEVDDLSSRFASALVGLGVKKGDRVAVFLPNIPQLVVSYFGILKAGGIVVMCNPVYKERELEHQLRDSGAEVVVASRTVARGMDLFSSLGGCRGRLPLRHVIATGLGDYLPGLKRRLAGLAGIRDVPRENTIDFVTLIRSNPPMAAYAAVDPVNDVAVLQYTGGTTGVSKGAMLTHYNLVSNAEYGVSLFPITERDISLCVLPLYHIYGLTVTMNAPLAAGAAMVLLPSFHVEEVMKTIQSQKVTIFSGAPAMYIAINSKPEARRYNLRSVRACLSGGSALPPAVRKKFIELTGGNLVEGYGLSETSPVTHCNPVTGGVVKDGSIGPPFSETDAKIVDISDREKTLKAGEIGELAVKGPQVMKGYWNQEEETKAVLKDGWFLTGDIAKMDPDGYFYIVDRKKDMINVGGLKVYPREVEDVLFEHPDVKEAGVIGVPNQFSGEAVKAFVVLKDPAKGTSAQELIEFCQERLAKFKVPKEVEFVQELPKTLIGKVLRRKLRETKTPQP